jgi:hypothetical protein
MSIPNLLQKIVEFLLGTDLRYARKFAISMRLTRDSRTYLIQAVSSPVFEISRALNSAISSILYLI